MAAINTRSSHVKVRMYHVGFGDCFLMTIVAAEGAEHRVLIDCGTHSGTDRSKKNHPPEFWETVKKLVSDLGPRKHIDVIVISHRHRDHVHGFSQSEYWHGVTVGEIWMPWTEDPQDPQATEVKEAQNGAALHSFHALRALRGAAPGSASTSAEALALNSLTNEKAFATLAGLKANKTRYLPATARLPQRLDALELTGVLPGDVTVHVLGPSRAEAVIRKMLPPANANKTYVKLQPLRSAVDLADGEAPELGKVPSPFEDLWVQVEPPLLDDDDTNLLSAVTSIAQSDPEALAFNVDSAVNGTSLVLMFDVGGLRLLFTGDAQWGTWEMMLTDPETKAILAQGSHLLKVGHHGSYNATPREFVETYLPKSQTQVAMVSVSPNVYETDGWKDIPRLPLLQALHDHVDLVVRADQKINHDQRVSRDPKNRWTEVTLDVPHDLLLEPSDRVV